MTPRHFRATTILCLAILAADLVVAQLPHTHSHAHGEHASCHHSACQTHQQHEHTCAHAHHGCSHSQAPQPAEQQTPVDSDVPCDHCTLCRHQSQAALPCTVVPALQIETFCAPVCVQQSSQIALFTPRVYQGRGPPSWL
ncbi:hypothetical protein NA78x_005686 [Anatilimnocola sp. NA78]|uniref:hypothetical protein n=1 Tax=Anatilimnocola sp. NA78 TaxID=3415683 RepID=UPI003CE5A1E6